MMIEMWNENNFEGLLFTGEIDSKRKMNKNEIKSYTRPEIKLERLFGNKIWVYHLMSEKCKTRIKLDHIIACI